LKLLALIIDRGQQAEARCGTARKKGFRMTETRESEPEVIADLRRISRKASRISHRAHVKSLTVSGLQMLLALLIGVAGASALVNVLGKQMFAFLIIAAALASVVSQLLRTDPYISNQNNRREAANRIAADADREIERFSSSDGRVTVEDVFEVKEQLADELNVLRGGSMRDRFRARGELGQTEMPSGR
jgi:hypothetical protein